MTMKTVDQVVSDTGLAFEKALPAQLTVGPNGMTPMGEGLKAAVGVTNADLGLYTNNANNARWLVLMSDGDTNQGTHPFWWINNEGHAADVSGLPVPSPDPVDLQAKRVKAATIAFGADYNSDVMIKLADSPAAFTEGKDHLVGGVTVDLRKAFQKILTTFAGLSAMADPAAQISSRRPLNLHSFDIEYGQERAVITVDWRTMDTDRLTVALISPLGEVFYEDQLSDASRFYFAHGPRSKLITLFRSFLNGDDVGIPRAGTWQLVVMLGDYGNALGNSCEIEDADIGLRRLLRDKAGPMHTMMMSTPEMRGPSIEDYLYNVYGRTALTMTAEAGDGNQRTGEPIRVRARVAQNGQPVHGASLSVTMKGPTASFAKWITQQSLDRSVYNRVVETLPKAVTDPWFIAKAVATAQNLSFDPLNGEIHAQMKEIEPGLYEAVLPGPRVPGNQEIRVIARGDRASGEWFRRETVSTVAVSAQPDASATLLDIEYEPSKDVANITVRPFDVFGNPILFDPNKDFFIRLAAINAQLSGALKVNADFGPTRVNYDGSYTQTVSYSAKPDWCNLPEVRLLFGSSAVLSQELDVPELQRQWADELVNYKAGKILKDSTNAYTNAKAVLGPYTGSADPFLALAAGGSVTVNCHSDCWRLGEATVYVKRSPILRPYEVQVQVAASNWPNVFHRPDKYTWVTVGQSRGITQSFDLSGLAGKPILALRIVDRSGVLKGSDGKPTDAPGALVQAVGFKPYERGHVHKPCDDQHGYGHR